MLWSLTGLPSDTTGSNLPIHMLENLHPWGRVFWGFFFPHFTPPQPERKQYHSKGIAGIMALTRFCCQKGSRPQDLRTLVLAEPRRMVIWGSSPVTGPFPRTPSLRQIAHSSSQQNKTVKSLGISWARCSDRDWPLWWATHLCAFASLGTAILARQTRGPDRGNGEAQQPAPAPRGPAEIDPFSSAKRGDRCPHFAFPTRAVHSAFGTAPCDSRGSSWFVRAC